MERVDNFHIEKVVDNRSRQHTDNNGERRANKHFGRKPFVGFFKGERNPRQGRAACYGKTGTSPARRLVL